MRDKLTEADLRGVSGVAMVRDCCQVTVLDALFISHSAWLEASGMRGDGLGHVVSLLRLAI